MSPAQPPLIMPPSIKDIDPRVDDYFAAMERSMKQAFAANVEQASSPAAPLQPPSSSHSAEEKQVSQVSPSAPAVQTGESQPVAQPPPARQLSVRPRMLTRAQSKKQGPRDEDGSPAAGRVTSAQMLGELLDKVAPPPVFEPERVLSPQRLAETGAGQAKLRQDIHCNLKRVIDVFRELDTDTSGAVDRREFRRGLGAILGKEYADDELDELFDVIDASGDGMIQYQELAKALRDAAPKPSCSTPATSSVHMQSSASARALPTSGSSAQHKVQRAASATAVTRRLRHGNGKERASGSVASPTDASPEDGARRAMRRSITGGDPEAGGRGACEGGEGGVEGDEAGSAHSWQAVLHPLRQREVLQLFAEFKQQHLDGVCKVGRFDRLLRIKYKTEGRDQIEAMMDLVIEREAEQQAEAARQEQAAKDAAVLFDALDVNAPQSLSLPSLSLLSLSPLPALFPACPLFLPSLPSPSSLPAQVDQSHEISLDEFLNLRKIVDDFRRDLSKSQLRALFYAADKDHDGAINFEEVGRTSPPVFFIAFHWKWETN